ncbi:MAG TPA: hypothetical protein VIJ15_09845 [Dermatophilaceae bacterium]
MDVHDRLNQLTAMIGSAKAMPMSASCLVNRAEMLGLLERLRADLPATLDHADAVLSDREAVLAAGREQAQRIVETACREREQLIAQSEVLLEARERAAEVTREAEAASIRLLADADDYVDRKLAEFDGLLGQLASQVNNGRLRLTARREADLARFQAATPGAVSGAAGRDAGPQDLARGSGSTSDPAVADHQSPVAADLSLQSR